MYLGKNCNNKHVDQKAEKGLRFLFMLKDRSVWREFLAHITFIYSSAKQNDLTDVKFSLAQVKLFKNENIVPLSIEYHSI